MHEVGRGVTGGRLFFQVVASIGARADASPFLESPMKRAGFLEAGGGGDLRYRHIATRQQVNRHVAAKVVPEALIMRALCLQAALQRGVGHVKFHRQVITFGPFFRA